jgi:hypothetical protein
MRIYYSIFHETDQIGFDWLGLCMTSLKKYGNAHSIILVTDNLSAEKRQELHSRFGIQVRQIPSKLWEGRRMLCKLEQLKNILNEVPEASNGVDVIMADTDIIFRGNPFGAFDEYQFDLGFATRFYPYPSPVNGGMVFLRNSIPIREFINQVCRQILSPSWKPYIDWKNPNNIDWNCDQDMLHAIYRNPVFFQDMFKIIVKDVGHKYNYCPGTDVFGTEAAFVLLKWAFIERVFPVLHFKGNAKDLLYEPGFGELLKCP